MTSKRNDGAPACAVCGSSSAVLEKNQRFLPVPYGEPAMVDQAVLSCPDCGSEIDVTEDEQLSKALEESRKASVKAMLEYLAAAGISQAHFERALDLPQRTVSRWKGSGELSSVGLALLRVIRTYPWVLDVAETKFEPFFAQFSLWTNAMDAFSSVMTSAGSLCFSAGGLMAQFDEAMSSPSEVCFFAKYGQPSAAQEGINLTGSEQTLFEEVPNEDS